MEPTVKYETNSSPPVMKINKSELATDIRSYIIHSRFIILKSPHAHYRNLRTLTHLDLCDAHCKMLKCTEFISLKDICQLTLILRKHLEGILPSTNNDSYQSSRMKLDLILEKCLFHLKSIQTNV